MNNLFQQTSTPWVKYSDYEYRQAENDKLYLTPTAGAKPQPYNPLQNFEEMVVAALNVGLLALKRQNEATLKAAIKDFVVNYGLLGFIAALPTTANFTDYTAVYLPKNHFIKAENLSTSTYISQFFPFNKLDMFNTEGKFIWLITDRTMIALSLTMQELTKSVIMSFQREYAEPYEWLVQEFRDLAFTFYSAFLYCQDKDKLSDIELDLYRQGIAAFGGIAPTYHIELLDKPTIVWDFHSLLRCLQMLFSFMLTAETVLLKLYPNCHKVFLANNPKTVFCSPECKNAFNVAKSKAKK